MEKQTDKFIRTFSHIYRNKTHCNRILGDKQRPHTTKHLSTFQYEPPNDTLSNKIKNVMSYLQVQCTSHARKLQY